MPNQLLTECQSMPLISHVVDNIEDINATTNLRSGALKLIQNTLTRAGRKGRAIFFLGLLPTGRHSLSGNSKRTAYTIHKFTRNCYDLNDQIV